MWRNSISYLIHVPQWNITTLISLLIICVHLQRTKEAPGVDKKVIPEFASIKMCTMAFFQMDFIFIPFLLCWMLMSVRRHEKERKSESKRYLSALDGIRCRSKNELFRWHRTQFAIKSEIPWIFSYLFRPENSRLIVSKINKKKFFENYEKCLSPILVASGHALQLASFSFCVTNELKMSDNQTNSPHNQWFGHRFVTIENVAFDIQKIRCAVFYWFQK